MSWEQYVTHTSTEETITAVMEARSRHWERYRLEKCPLDDCKQHPTPTPLVDRLHLIDWRIVEPHMKGTP